MKTITLAFFIFIVALTGLADFPAYVHNTYDTNDTATADAHVLALLGGTGVQLSGTNIWTGTNTFTYLKLANAPTGAIAGMAVLDANGNVFSNSPPGSAAYAGTNDFLPITYNLKDFGAYGDAQCANGALALSSSTTVNVTLGHFVSGDVGAMIDVCAAGVNRRDFWTTISAVNTSTQIVLSAAVPVSYNTDIGGGAGTMPNGYAVIYGTHDDTVAIQAWINQITNSGGTFFEPSGVYLIAGALQLTNQNNAQIIVPVPGWNSNPTNRPRNYEPVMDITGPPGGRAWFVDSVGQINFDKNSAVFVSNLQGPDFTGTNKFGASVIDFRGYNPGNVTVLGQHGAGAASTTQYYWPNNPVRPIFNNFNLYVGYDANCVGLNLIASSEAEGNNVNVGSFLYPSACPPMTGTNGWGIVMPGNFNGTLGDLNNVQIWGFFNGLDMGLIKGDYLTFGVCSNALTGAFSGGAGPAIINNIQFTDCPNWIRCSGGNFYSGAGAAGSKLNPILTVADYQSQILPGSIPDWLTNGSVSVFDPSNTLAAGSMTILGEGQGQSLLSIPANQGAGGIGGGIRFYVNKYNSAGWNDGTPHVWNGAQTFTGLGNVTFSNYFVFRPPNSAPVMYNANAPGDLIYCTEGTRGSGWWNRGVSDTLIDPFPVADWFLQPLKPGVGPVLPGSANALTVTTNGSLYVYKNIYSLNGIFNGNASGVTNANLSLQNATGIPGGTAVAYLGTNSSGALVMSSPSGSGTVTSVTFTGDGTVLSSTPSSAVTSSGTVTGTLLAQSANTVFGNFTGGSAAPTFSASPVFSGAGLTALNASALASGAMSPSVLPWVNTNATAGQGLYWNAALSGYYPSNPPTAGTITLTGDVTGSGTTSIATTMKNTGTAGSYAVTTFDAQGRETSGRDLTAADVPLLGSTNTAFTQTTTNFYGPTNAFVFNNGYQVWNTSTNITLTNTYTYLACNWGVLVISNIGGSSISYFSTNIGAAVGTVSTNIYSIPSHKTFVVSATSAGIFCNAPGQ